MKSDFMASFNKLFRMCGNWFHNLIQALLILVPK
jgi:hypothetical protein